MRTQFRPCFPTGQLCGIWRTWCRGHIPRMERGDEWHWTLRLKTDPLNVIGLIGLIRNGENNQGFWLRAPWQRQGLMTEAVEAVTDYWFQVLGFPVLRVPKAVANTASRRISEKSGMRVVSTGVKQYVSGRLLTEVWEITAEEWRVNQKKPDLFGVGLRDATERKAFLFRSNFDLIGD